MFCQNCGQPQSDGAFFCSRCGWKLIRPENLVVPAPAVAEAEPTPEVGTPMEEPVADVVSIEPEQQASAEEAAPADPYVLPKEDPAAIPDETGTYVPPVQPFIPVSYPQYGYGYPGAMPGNPPYPYYGAPMPQYPHAGGAPYAPTPYYPPYPVYPQYPNPAPVAPPPEVKDVPPAKKGRRRVPIIIMAILMVIGLALFFFGPGKSLNLPQTGTAQSQSDTPWFSNEDGTLYFNADLYTGPEELTVPETVDGQTVVSISQDCFAGCDTLTTVVLPDTVEEIGSGAFSDCASLRGIFIPNGVKSIGSAAFENCTSLEAIYIPATVKAIGRNAFRGCTKLAHIMYEGTYAQWYSMYNGYISDSATVYCYDGTFPQSKFTP